MGVERWYSSVELQPVGEECGRENHTRPKGLGALMNWGQEKMLIRCNKDVADHPAEWALGLRLSSPGERERHNADGHNSGVKILQFMCGLQFPLTVKPHTTFSNTCNKVRGKYFVKEVFLRASVYHCFGMHPVYIYIYIYFCMNQQMTIQHKYCVSY